MSTKESKIKLLNALRPMIKECIREVILEEGVLRNVIAETIMGVLPLVEVAAAPPSVAETSSLKGNDLGIRKLNLLQELDKRNMGPETSRSPDHPEPGGLKKPSKPMDSQAREAMGEQPMFPEEMYGGEGVDLSIFEGSKNWAKMVS